MDLVGDLDPGMADWLATDEASGDVLLYCPEDGHVVATENTSPDVVRRDIDGYSAVATYRCDCGARHTWAWGPPTPIRVVWDSPDESADG